ncbi:PQQ-dependent sugar dehydrogenase [Novosphingobium sp.]|uniref:PQQ-dependent sugar dehydrogenase n=1 Tax=Novosphingobium sp. TaxID=1874826 RepID=UPI001EC0A8C8|nr:PQQ-dependent sugar dehydrogenase [Novosphingobium sp.]MBK9010585.1 PQQ-dependent sugar dehydrogenase [Novosphingobium sp.]
MNTRLLSALSPLVLIAASCGAPAAGDSPPATRTQQGQFAIQELGTFDEPWAMAQLADGALLVTEKKGRLLLWQQGQPVAEVAGVPQVAYGGQGGLGDVIVHPSGKAIYLSWAEAGEGETRGAVVARAELVRGGKPSLANLEVIWRQTPKVTGRGHYSHRLAVSPDGRHLFIASGDRQKMQPAQDPGSDLGKLIRLPIDAAGKPTGAAERYSLGHRNILGLQFAPDGRLWEIEHGPAGGDELNLVRHGANYGWPLVSEGRHYGGEFIPPHSTRPDFAAPSLAWNPVIAPGGMVFYTGKMWPEWQGQLLIGAMNPAAVVRVKIDGDKASEEARYPMDKRIRAIAQASDGALLVLEDRAGGRLLRLSRK